MQMLKGFPPHELDNIGLITFPLPQFLVKTAVVEIFILKFISSKLFSVNKSYIIQQMKFESQSTIS